MLFCICLLATFVTPRFASAQEWADAWRLQQQNSGSRVVASANPLKMYETPPELDAQMRKLIRDSGAEEKDAGLEAKAAFCSVEEIIEVPRQVFSEDTARYPFLESSLQIFQNLTMPCDGSIKSFRFLSAKTDVKLDSSHES